MKNFVLILQILAKPITILVALWWFGDEFKKILTAISDYVERLKTLRGTVGSASIEAEAKEELQQIQLLEPTSATAAQPTKAAIPDVVEAKQFILRDDSGVSRAELSTDKMHGSAAFRLFDSHGKRLVSIGVFDDRSYLILDSPNEQGSAVIFASKTGPVFVAAGPRDEPDSYLKRERLVVNGGKFVAP